ncbi:hypothetical protein K1X76_08320 [bacterium]|nr:hypothetical protein [bacterium]
MANTQPIETNYVDMTGATTTAQQRAVSGTNFYDTMNQLMYYAGPTAAQTAAYTGHDVVSAAITASAGGYGGGYAGYPGMSTGGMGYTGYPSASVGFNSGGVGASVSYGGSSSAVSRSTGTSDTMSLVSDQLYQGQVQNMEMLVLQNQVADVNRTWQIASTVSANSEQTKMAMVRNMRG